VRNCSVKGGRDGKTRCTDCVRKMRYVRSAYNVLNSKSQRVFEAYSYMVTILLSKPYVVSTRLDEKTLIDYLCENSKSLRKLYDRIDLYRRLISFVPKVLILLCIFALLGLCVLFFSKMFNSGWLSISNSWRLP